MIDFFRKIIYLGIKKKSYSQDNEDIFLLKYFENIKNGFYVDIGCHHPKRFSNTYLLYKKGWRGINIDANKLTINLFKIFRSRDKSYCKILSTSSKPVNFYEFSDSALNGILDPKQALELKKIGYKIKSKKKITPTTIQEITKQFRLKEKHINFFKIDIEGMDFEIIKNLEFSEIDIDLIMIEKSEPSTNKKLIHYLNKKSYFLLFESKRNFLFKKNFNNA